MLYDIKLLGNIIPDRNSEDYDFFMRAYCDRHQFTFPVFYKDSPVKEIYKVNPIKQVEVSRLYEVVNKYEVILHAWVIGSACNPMCTQKSDTDMIIETSVEPHTYTKELEEATDALFEVAANGLDLLRLEELSVREPISYEIYWRLRLK